MQLLLEMIQTTSKANVVAWMQNKSNLDFGSCYPFATQIILLLKN
jgi:hypothetical protein